jgi:hypothetical protein
MKKIRLSVNISSEKLHRYLLEEGIQDKLGEAINIHYLPIALMKEGSSEEEIQLAAIRSITRLVGQIEEIRIMVLNQGIDLPDSVLGIMNGSKEARSGQGGEKKTEYQKEMRDIDIDLSGVGEDEPAMNWG